MGKLICIGEALIDFMPSQAGRLRDVSNFTRCPGGAPANVAAAAARLGVQSMVVTKLGADSFGDFLVTEIARTGASTTGIARTCDAHTALAFVSHTDSGDRDFLFYRNPSADMLLSPDDVLEEWFQEGDVLHFCSVSLVDAPCRKAHDKAIQLAKERGILISFDINLRFPLWEDADELKDVVLQYIHYADIVKVSQEEQQFLGPFTAPHLIVTMGSKGATLDGTFVPAFPVEAIDATGAGDAFIGCFLAELLQGNPFSPELLAYCHAVAGIVVSRRGALNAMPTTDEVELFLKAHGQS